MNYLQQQETHQDIRILDWHLNLQPREWRHDSITSTIWTFKESWFDFSESHPPRFMFSEHCRICPWGIELATQIEWSYMCTPPRVFMICTGTTFAEYEASVPTFIYIIFHETWQVYCEMGWMRKGEVKNYCKLSRQLSTCAELQAFSICIRIWDTLRTSYMTVCGRRSSLKQYSL